MAVRKKTGGRQKGTPNKTTKSIRESIDGLIGAYASSGKMNADFDALTPHERLTVAEKMMQYAVPKMKSIDVKMDASEVQVSLADKLRELSEEQNM